MNAPAERFQNIFDFTPRATAARFGMIQHGAIVAKLRELAQGVQALEASLDQLANKYKDAATVLFEEAKKDVVAADRLDTELAKVLEEFKLAVAVAGENQFSVSEKLSDYLPRPESVPQPQE